MVLPLGQGNDEEDKLLDKFKVITPHIKEFHSLFPDINKKKTNLEKINYAKKKVNCTIVLKSHKTS